jgi:hypothetical protein
MSAYVEVDSISRYSLEFAYGRALQEQNKQNWTWAMTGMRAARARDQKMLKVLEHAANLIQQIDEDQHREHRRSTDKYAESLMTTETQMWVEAYKTMDKGDPCENLMWIYGAAACLAGYVA